MSHLCSLNVVLPWDQTLFGETFQTKDINLKAPKERKSFKDYEQSNYEPKLRMKLSTYTEDKKPYQDRIFDKNRKDQHLSAFHAWITIFLLSHSKHLVLNSNR